MKPFAGCPDRLRCMDRLRCRDRLRCLAVAGMMAVAGAADAADAISARVDLDDGQAAEGALIDIGATAVTLAGPDGTRRAIPLETVRLVTREDALSPPAAARVRLVLTDGTSITGDDFNSIGSIATLTCPAGPVRIPLGRIRSLDCVPASSTGRESWLDALPEGVTSDLVAIGKGEGFEFVECAIKQVDPDTVTVVLDDETIPVKRAKVAGLLWLRGDAPGAAGRTLVDVIGGTLRADAVAWTEAGLVLDAEDVERKTSLPAAALRRIDFAAGRTTLLAGVAPERVEVEPFFGGLAGVAGLAGYFAPRPAPADARFTKPGLVVRPRTVAVWRIPPRSRRFRTSLALDSEGAPAAVTVTVDDRLVLERLVSGPERTPVEIDIAGGRRLGVKVDFGPGGGMAGAVRFEEPAIEQ